MISQAQALTPLPRGALSMVLAESDSVKISGKNGHGMHPLGFAALTRCSCGQIPRSSRFLCPFLILVNRLSVGSYHDG